MNVTTTGKIIIIMFIFLIGVLKGLYFKNWANKIFGTFKVLNKDNISIWQ
jgi:hypothetical protein